MKGLYRTGYFRNVATLAIVSLSLFGCLMEDEVEEEGGNPATVSESGTGEPGTIESGTVAVDAIAFDNEISGSVGDGPIVGATIRILRNDGVELTQLENDARANYNIKVQTKGKYYPLSVHATNGTDIVTNTAPDFDLESAVLDPGKKSVANVNPFSTFAVELARDLSGGPDKTNLVTAEGIVISQLNSGLSTLMASGVIATKIDGSNIAEIVRASEALGETVRRTRDALNVSGLTTSGNAVVAAIASDLIDSVVDGRGGPRADARFAAVWNIVSAQVLLETMANELHVNGANATTLLSNAIQQVSVGTPKPSLAELTATPEMIARAKIGIVAAHTVTGDSAFEDLLTSVANVQAGSSASRVRNQVLPDDYRSLLGNAVVLVADGESAVLESVNQVSRLGTQTIELQAAETQTTETQTTETQTTETQTTETQTTETQTTETQTIDPDPVTGSVTLTWIEPTQNEDGSPLVDLAGYKIYWGTMPGNYPNTITIADKSITSHVVDGLSSGSYEFVATSFNSAGVESKYSAAVIRTVP